MTWHFWRRSVPVHVPASSPDGSDVLLELRNGAHVIEVHSHTHTAPPSTYVYAGTTYQLVDCAHEMHLIYEAV